MRTDLLTVGRLVFCGIEVWMVYLFISSMFVKRAKGRRLAGYCVGTVLIIFLENAFGNTFLNLALMPVIYLIFNLWVFRISWSSGIVYTLIYFIIFGGGREVAFEILYRLISVVSPFDIAAWDTPYGMRYLAAEYILSLLFLLFILRFTKRLEINEKDGFCWYLLIMPAATLIVLMTYLYIDFPESDLIGVMMCAGAFFLYFSNAVIFIILEKYTEMMKKVRMAQLSDMKKDMERANYDHIDKANLIYKKYLHDMHKYFNQFRILAAKGETQMIVRIVDQVEGELKAEESSIIYCKDTILNVLLGEYEGRAKEQGISAKFFVEEGLDMGFISDGDKISMFGNLLDNAMEAAAWCQEGERWMRVQVYMGNPYFLIVQIKNSCSPKIGSSKGRFFTTKSDGKNHGLGIRIVEDLAEKYGGSLELKAEGGTFEALLMVSSYGNAEEQKL